MDEKLKTTPLNSWHRESGANMADFGGFDMPLWYNTGVKKEHLAVLESAGIFDTSHMACLMVMGPDALDLLQLCHTRDIVSLKEGRCVYGVILNDSGHVIDDAIVYKFSNGDCMVCVNAGMGSVIANHFIKHSQTMKVEIEDLSEKLGKIDIQGKDSARILSKLIESPETIFHKMPYFSFKGHFDKNSALPSQVILKDSQTPILLSRSGYTGEFGFEIFISPDKTVALWHSILEAGKEFNVTPCGLGARDSLRTGAVLPLSHQDIGEWKFTNNPWMFALFLKSDGTGFAKEFIGKEPLIASDDAKHTYPFVGENLRKVGTGDDTIVIDKDNNTIGKVLTCATDMGIGWHENKILSVGSPDLPEDFKAKGISCGFIFVEKKLSLGEKLVLQENKRKIKVTVVDDIRPDRTARKKISNFL